VLAKVPGVGVGNGTGCGFTGSYDEVAKRIVAFHEAGVEMILLEFQPSKGILKVALGWFLASCCK
jgi:alkanesulfonate monooxygenase